MTLTPFGLSFLSVFLTHGSFESLHLGPICASQKRERGPIKKKRGAFQFPLQTHLLVSTFIPIRVHGRQEVDSCLSHQPNNTPVALFVFFAQVLHEVEDELSTKDLVAVHSCHVAKLWLSCQREHLESMWVNVNMNRASEIKSKAHLDCLCLCCVNWLHSASDRA